MEAYFLPGLGSTKVAGVLGFEPRNGGVKVRCLTTWRYPNTEDSRIIVKNGGSQGFFLLGFCIANRYHYSVLMAVSKLSVELLLDVAHM
jgi:hypothetical protein